MSIFDNYRMNKALSAKVQELEQKVTKQAKDQELLVKDILSYYEAGSLYKGNEYQDYGTAVVQISNKYKNIADWGCIIASAIIDLRAAFILGEGVKIIAKTPKKEDAIKELKFANDFFEYNDLDGEMAQEIAKEAEIEGKIALSIALEEEQFKDWPAMVSARFVSWTSKGYKIICDPDDYLWYKNMEWTDKDKGQVSLTEDQFVYKKFGGRLNDPNDAQPKIMKCLTLIDRLDHALKDLRSINNLYASPTPVIKCASAAEVTAIQAKIKDTNWKIGKLFITTAEFSYKSIDPSGTSILTSEIETLIKMISGTTGIPIHFLGLLDLLKNRATGDNTLELVLAATARDRETWKGAFEELIRKAMELYNATVLAQKSVKLDPSKVGVEIPKMTQEQWTRIEKVLIPAAIGGIITKEFVASQIPGIDQDEEAKRREANMKAEEADIQDSLDGLMDQDDNGAKDEPIGKNIS